MTLPLNTGYPDWERAFAESHVLEVNDVNVTQPASIVYPIRYVGSAKALFVWAQPTTQSCRFRLRFYGDAAGTTPTDSYTMDAQSSDIIVQPVPILGPYMDIVVLPSAAGNFTYSLQVWRTPSLGHFQGGLARAALVSKFNQAIGANATVDYRSQYITAGPVIWVSTCTAASWQAYAVAKDYQGNETILDFYDNNYGARAQPRQFYAPPSTLIFRMTNFDAAPKNQFTFATQDLRP
jgi:hypothetical protein